MSRPKTIKPINSTLKMTEEANTSPGRRFSKLKDMMKKAKPPKIPIPKGFKI